MLLIAHGVTVLDPQGEAEQPRLTIRRAAMAPLLAGDVLAVGAVPPHRAREVGLEVGETIAIALGVANESLLANGELVVRAARIAVMGRSRGDLRALRTLFPCVLRMREVHEFLDGLPPEQARQVAGLERGLGRKPDPVKQAGLVVTMDLLCATGLTAADAADRVTKISDNVMADRLQNLYCELRHLTRCLREGYRIPASDVPCLPWGQSLDDELSVFVKTF
jgi:hypothetical protein